MVQEGRWGAVLKQGGRRFQPAARPLRVVRVAHQHAYGEAGAVLLHLFDLFHLHRHLLALHHRRRAQLLLLHHHRRRLFLAHHLRPRSRRCFLCALCRRFRLLLHCGCTRRRRLRLMRAVAPIDHRKRHRRFRCRRSLRCVTHLRCRHRVYLGLQARQRVRLELCLRLHLRVCERERLRLHL